jgi:hypothetical protein
MDVISPLNPIFSFDSLPDELKLKIFEMANLKMVSIVSQEWNRVASDSLLWKKEFFSVLKISYGIENDGDIPAFYHRWKEKFYSYNIHRPPKAYTSRDVENPWISTTIVEALINTDYKKLALSEFNEQTQKYRRAKTLLHVEGLENYVNLNAERIIEVDDSPPLSSQYSRMQDFIDLQVCRITDIENVILAYTGGTRLNIPLPENEQQNIILAIIESKKLQELNTDFLTNLLSTAAQKNHLRIIDTILSDFELVSKIAIEDSDKIGKILLSAVESCQNEIIDSFSSNSALLEKIPGDGKFGLGLVLRKSAEKNSEHLLNKILSNEIFWKKIPSEGQNSIGNILNILAYKNFSQPVEKILSNSELLGKIPQEGDFSIGGALSSLARHGHTNLVAKILANDFLSKNIPGTGLGLHYGLGNALYYAAKEGHIKVVKMILSNHELASKIPGDTLYGIGGALLEATKNFHTAVMETLLENDDFKKKISIEGSYGIMSSLAHATSDNHLDVFLIIFSHIDLIKRIPIPFLWQLRSKARIQNEQIVQTIDNYLNTLPRTKRYASWLASFF